MHILKVFNNNVVLAADQGGRHYVLTGRGLGFQCQAGDVVDQRKVVQRFVAEDSAAMAKLVAFLQDLPPEDVALAARLLERGSAELGVSLPSANVLPLADHLSFALKRHRNGLSVDYPLAAEVPHLFPDEYRFALKALDEVWAATGVRLPDGEAVPIALHFVTAQSTLDMPRTFKMASIFEQIFDVLDSAYGVRFDRMSLSAARFITHLRYFFIRHETGKPFDEPGIGGLLRDQHPDAWACAERVRLVLELRLGGDVNANEVAYLAMHIARLSADVP